MNSKCFTYKDCCLLSNIEFNSERISYLLENRFKSNSTQTSFDFKSFLPEQPANNTKVSRSLLKSHRVQIASNNDDEWISSTSSDEETEDSSSSSNSSCSVNDDYLKELAEWEPKKSQLVIENNDEEESRNDSQTMIHEDTHAESMGSATEIPTAEVEDLLITFIHCPVKGEPITYDDSELIPLQLDGQTDSLSGDNPEQIKHVQEQKNLEQIVAKIKSNISKPNKAIEIHNVRPSFNTFQADRNHEKKTTDSTRKTVHKSPKKKIIPPLLPPLLRTNEDVIRPLDKCSRLPSTIESRIVSTQTHDQQPTLEPSVWEHLTFVQQKPNVSLPIPTDNSNSMFSPQKDFPKNLLNESKPLALSISKNMNKRKRLTSDLNNQLAGKKRTPTKSKKLLAMEHTGRTLLDYFKVIKHISTNDMNQYDEQEPNQMKLSDNKRKQRSKNYFDGCIVIDDDDDDDTKIITEHNDIEEIEQKSYSISTNIHSREKHLDHAIHSSSMRIKWLLNLDILLLEHILLCHQENIHPLNQFYTNPLIKQEPMDNPTSYSINSSLISTIILNFVKMFILKTSTTHEDELSFYQFSFTSHLRYLLIELPTYNHVHENICQQCHEYSSILQQLFDLLFDLIEYDLCEIFTRENYRSSLIENDYFHQFFQQKTVTNRSNQFDRIKLIIYFIELIAIHMNKCPNKKDVFFYMNDDRFFQWIEEFLRHIINQMSQCFITERLSICFNIMELCILFVTKRENRTKQMAVFLARLCEENSKCLDLFLFNENLLVDIRLLLINELFWKKFNIKLNSMECIDDIFQRLTITDDMSILLIRSLFNSYADLLMSFKYSTSFKQITSILRYHFKVLYETVMDLSQDSTSFEPIKRTQIFFRLLKCKWNRL